MVFILERYPIVSVKVFSVGPLLRIWSVIKHMYPVADVPVIQMSLDYQQTPQYNYELTKELSSLRNKDVLIIGSGYMVHNLRMVDWRRLDEVDYGYDWAIETREKMKNNILSGDHKQLINYQTQRKEFSLAIPTPEHYLPLLYALALKNENEHPSLFNDKAVVGSATSSSTSSHCSLLRILWLKKVHTRFNVANINSSAIIPIKNPHLCN